MNIKHHEKELELFGLTALYHRLAKNHPMKEAVRRDLKIKKAEISGEKQVIYPLGFLEEDHYLILHNIKLQDKNGYFQIDTLLLSQKFLLILEVKNWQGSIVFGENGQVTRIRENDEEGFPNPIPQAKTQLFRLRKWLTEDFNFDLPFEFLVIIGFPSTILKTSSPNISIPNKVIHSNALYFRIKELEEQYPNSIMEMDQLKIIAEKLRRSHIFTTENILEKYNINRDELLNGVFCPSCNALYMIRKNRKWYCHHCNYTSINAHFDALNDYKLLIMDEITNKELRNFLQIESANVASYLLKMANYSVVGKNRGRKYQITFRSNDDS